MSDRTTRKEVQNRCQERCENEFSIVIEARHKHACN